MTCNLISDLAGGIDKMEALSRLTWQFRDSPRALQMVHQALQGNYFRDVYRKQGGGYVFETFNIALHSLFKFDNFEDSLIYTVNLGGDADSQATVAGAFAGAFYGIDQIPTRWKNKLNPVSCVEIEEKAKKLYIISKNAN